MKKRYNMAFNFDIFREARRFEFLCTMMPSNEFGNMRVRTQNDKLHQARCGAYLFQSGIIDSQ